MSSSEAFAARRGPRATAATGSPSARRLALISAAPIARAPRTPATTPGGAGVQQTTRAAAGAVQPVSPPVAGVVNSAGSGAAKTVTGVTQAIAAALSGVGGH